VTLLANIGLSCKGFQGKHCSLLGHFASEEEKSFITLAPGESRFTEELLPGALIMLNQVEQFLVGMRDTQLKH
jgi:hypothetical protein